MRRVLVLIALLCAFPTQVKADDACYTTNQACGWALLDENNNVTTVIVCTFDVCGNGTFDGKRTVLQTKPSTDGNVAGYNRGTYNEPSNTFTLDDGRTLEGGAGVNEVVQPTPPTTAVPETSTTAEVPTSSSAPTVTEPSSSTTVTQATVIAPSTKPVPRKSRRVPQVKVPSRGK